MTTTSSTTDAGQLARVDQILAAADPVAGKARQVGDWSLNRRAPEFSLYR